MAKRKKEDNIICPVCGKYNFDKNKVYSKIPSNVLYYCPVCGWKFDEGQLNDFDLKVGRNQLSVNEFKVWFKDEMKFRTRVNFRKREYTVQTPHLCPVCLEFRFEDMVSYEICPICGWQDCGMEDDPDIPCSELGKSFNETKEWFQKKREENPKFKWINDIKK